MRAAVFHEHGGPLAVEQVPDPAPPDDGVVLEVGATGICRSDWHAWMGHDPDVAPPHVPGHELAGTVVAVGADVRGIREGERVTVPFCLGCGRCGPCRAGETQICDDDYQPGFTGWGSFAEYVALPHAELNLVRLPAALGFVEAAALGCRFMTAYAAIAVHGRPAEGDWVAVHGCGGVGLSAIMVAVARGAGVVAVDVDEATLELARSLGAAHTVDARATARGVDDRGRRVARAGVDQPVGAERAGQLELVRVDVDRHHARPERAGDHHRGQPDAAAPVDRHPVAGPDPSLQRGEGGHEAAAEARGLHEAELLRQPDEVEVRPRERDELRP